MKKILFALFVLFNYQLVLAQEVKKITLSTFENNLKDKENYRKKELPQLNCIQFYALLNKYIHQKDKRTSAKAIQSLADFYNTTQKGDSCQEIRVQITKDYLTFIQTDSISSSKYGLMEIALSELEQVLSIEILKQLGGREVILSLLKNKKYKGVGLRHFIVPLQLVEMLPELWDSYNKTSIMDNNGYTKSAFLVEILKLGDSTAMTVYKKTLWDYTKDTTRVIHERYFYELLVNITRLKNRELIGQLFEMLAYLIEHPEKNKKIYLYTFSDDNEPVYWSLGETIYYKLLIRIIANLPDKHYKYPYLKYTPENIRELLKWYNQNPNFEIKK